MNTIQKRVDNLKANVKNLNKEAINISDNMVEASLATGAKWQKLMAKAITEGTTLFGKQQDLVFNTLEEVKGQMLTSNKRFRKLIGLDLPKAKATTKKVATPKNGVKEKTAKVSTAKTVKVATPKATKKTTPAVPKTVKKTAPVKTTITKDDLKTINGIGPKVETLLNQAGVTTFHRLAATPIKDLKAIIENAGPIFKSMDPTLWKKEANKAINGK